MLGEEDDTDFLLTYLLWKGYKTRFIYFSMFSEIFFYVAFLIKLEGKMKDDDKSIEIKRSLFQIGKR